MFTIRTAEKNDEKKINDLIENEGIANLKSKFGLQDVAGELVEFKPYIVEVLVKSDLRKKGLGDSLLRTILYYWNNKGVKVAYASKDAPFAEFLKHMKFKELDDRLNLDLESFFAAPCKGCSQGKK
jgi:N-acetylglutamate synthase-like GNAT family acetyltransferase